MSEFPASEIRIRLSVRFFRLCSNIVPIKKYTGKSRGWKLNQPCAVSAHKYWSMSLILERGTPLPVLEHILDYFGYGMGDTESPARSVETIRYSSMAQTG